MNAPHLIVLSVPGLRRGDIDRAKTPTLFAWANRGAIAELTPTFPCVTSCVQASMFTGSPPARHGVIANGFFDRERRAVAFWVGKNDVVTGEPVWDAMRARRSGLTSAVWHAQNIKGASADYIVTPAPIHEADGSTKPWCYSKPGGLYEEMLATLGHFPLQHYWGPHSNIESTKWILRAAVWLIEKHRPNFHWIYVPHLDYAGQKFGPDSSQAGAALGELDKALAEFAAAVAESSIGKVVKYLVTGEYALTPVRGVVYPNRILREAGLLDVRECNGTELIDFESSQAFAMVDHQFAHLILRHPTKSIAERVAGLFRARKGVVDVCAGEERTRMEMNHPRSGDVILVAEDDHWFAYYWWLQDRTAPPFARTVDIHQKPGYDPVELFFDPATRGIPLNAELVRGSHGVPATAPRHRSVILSSAPLPKFDTAASLRDVNVKRISLALMGCLDA